MIVRILGEGQFEVDQAAIGRLEALDAELDSAISSGDEARFQKALEALVGEVRSAGRPLEPATIVPSDLAVPPAGSTLAEVRSLLASGEAADGR